VRRYEARVRERVDSLGARRVSEGRRVLGVHALKLQRKDGRPKTSAARRKLDPAIASRDPARRVSLLRELRAFRDAFREARRGLFEGDTRVLFPRGTLLMASLPTVRCERGPPCVLQAA
jgi:hypothetical protein